MLCLFWLQLKLVSFSNCLRRVFFLVDDYCNCDRGCQTGSEDIKIIEWSQQSCKFLWCIWGSWQRLYSNGVSFFAVVYLWCLRKFLSWFYGICESIRSLILMGYAFFRLCEGGELLDRILSRYSYLMLSWTRATRLAFIAISGVTPRIAWRKTDSGFISVFCWIFFMAR